MACLGLHEPQLCRFLAMESPQPGRARLLEETRSPGLAGDALPFPPPSPPRRCSSPAPRWRPSRCAAGCWSTPPPRASLRSRPVPTASSTSCASRTPGCPTAATCPPSSTSALWVRDRQPELPVAFTWSLGQRQPFLVALAPAFERAPGSVRAGSASPPFLGSLGRAPCCVAS